MDGALAELVTGYTQIVTPPHRWPTPGPDRGQSPTEWAAEVARLRHQHDVTSLEAARLFGGPREHVRVGTVRYDEIPVEGGTIACRIYTPAGRGRVPIIALLHGGGWWTGGGAIGFDLNDPLCRELCAGLPAVVVNVDYRLAPEHPYPTQLDDVHRALRWITTKAGSLGADPLRMGVLGVSSGGNLAAAVALLARDRGGPPIRAQFLLVPALDATASSPSMRALDPPSYAHKLLARALYASGHRDLRQPYLSPVLAPDLSGLPATVLVVGEFDPLRDEGRTYAGRLRAAGVPVTLLEYSMTHTLGLPDVMQRWRRDLLAAAAGLL